VIKKLVFSKWLKIVLGVFLAIIAIGVMSVGFFIDVQWFKEVGYFDVFMTKFIASAFLVVPIFLVSFIALFIYFKSMKTTILAIVGVNKLKVYRVITSVGNLLFSLGLGIVVAFTNWREILEFINAQSFGMKDPIFSLDISFYMFKLPIIDSMYQSLFTVLIVMVAITFLVYMATSLQADTGNTNRVIHLNSRGEGILKFAGKQLAVIAAMAMLLFSIGYIIKGFDLVYSPRGIAYGASYTDVKVTLLFYRVISVASIIGAIMIAIGIAKKKVKLIIGAGISIFGLVVLQPIVAAFVQQVIVKSNELEFEKPYIEYNIDATKFAYGIDNIEVKEFNPTNDLNSEKLEANSDIIDNLKVNSAEPVLNFYKQVQLIKNYYTFNDVDTDRYEIDGEYSQVFIAPREIDTSGMDIWQNKHLRYTHGYGLAMSEVNQVTKEGQPSFVMRDIPTTNTTDLKVDNPRIYFGESTNDYSIVNTDIIEFDYPDGETENEFKYDGDAGIPMNQLNKLAFAIAYSQPKMIFSGAINDDSRILINRNILDRAKKIAPFLTYDSDPYPVVYEDRIVWVIDAYTTSNKYPFSEPYKDINYIRNSVKITVDAYSGDINFYVTDEGDPIIKTYSKIFEGLFKPMSEMPKEIQSHFRYPQDMFNLQTEVLAKYHVNDAMKLFTQEDLWDVSGRKIGEEVSAGDGQENTSKEVELLYLMSRLHGEENLEMMLFEYFNMKGKQNMVSLLGARMDGDSYGDLIMYKFPQQRAVYSPDLFKNRMMQDPDISKEISLWAGKGSEVVYGDVVILPIEDSLLYMNTIYLKAEAANGIPEMKRVVLSNGDKIVIEENVEKALEKLFDYSGKDEEKNPEGEKPEEGDKIDPESGGESFGEAANLFNEAIEAQKSGDWAKYGELINKLGDMLNNLSGNE
jgi:hypothetical protein